MQPSNPPSETAFQSSVISRSINNLIQTKKMDSFVKWFLIVCTVVAILYYYGTRNYNYWKKKGVPQLSTVPFLGNNLFGFLTSKNALQASAEIYLPFKDKRFVGIYMGQKSFLSVTDPELLRQILVKDADSFLNRHDLALGIDPLMSKTLLSLQGENWRRMRTVMTTVFTSAKMKDMFGFMDQCGRQTVEHLQEKLSEHAKSDPTGKAVYEREWKEVFSRYGTDVIGSTAFGFEVNSFKNPDNEFYKSGLVIRDVLKGVMALKIFFIMSFPSLTKALGMTFLGTKYNNFFISLIEDTIKEREKKNIVRKDVIHVLMEARKGKGVDENGEPIKGKLPDLTAVDIAAQALVFFLGGFETMATLLGFVAYELAVNPDVQEQLQQEIDEVIERENGVTYYGVVQQMQYLDMVISETLRKWPPATATDRAVTKTYTIPKTDTSPEVVLKEGDNIWVSILGLHYDPEHFPDPHKFDPERFRNEKTTIKPFTYLPFGEGLRHCIGMRYALMETKVILVHLLRKFSFVPGKKTNIPMKLVKKGVFLVHPEDGFWLGITPRQ